MPAWLPCCSLSLLFSTLRWCVTGCPTEGHSSGINAHMNVGIY